MPKKNENLIQLLRGDFNQVARRHRSCWKRLGVAVMNRGMQAILLYRLSHAAWKRGIPLVPLVLSRIAQHLYAVDIAYQARIGPGLVIVHGFGVVIGSDVEMGENCCLFHGVTLGDRGSEWVASSLKDGHPVVGPLCMFGAGAKVLGPVRIGGNSVIGANAVVLKDVPENSVVAGVPAVVVGTRPLMDENLRPIGGAQHPVSTADDATG